MEAVNRERIEAWCAECCAQLLLAEACKIWSRTEKGFLLCEMAEQIGKGAWREVAEIEGLEP